MAKSFRELLSQAGYATNRADSPNVMRERVETNIGISSRGLNSDGVGGPSTLVQDDFGPETSGQVRLPKQINDIATPGVIESTRGMKLPSSRR